MIPGEDFHQREQRGMCSNAKCLLMELLRYLAYNSSTSACSSTPTSDELSGFLHLLESAGVDVNREQLISLYHTFYQRLASEEPLASIEKLWYNALTKEKYYQDLSELMHFCLKYLVRCCNECIVESFCSSYMLHDSRLRPLSDEAVQDELFVDMCGPPDFTGETIAAKSTGLSVPKWLAFLPPKTKYWKLTISSYTEAAKSRQSDGELESKIKSAVKNPLVQKAIMKSKKYKGSDGTSVTDLKILNERFMSGHLPRIKPSHRRQDEGDDEDDDDDDDDNDDDNNKDDDNSTFSKKTPPISMTSKIFKYQLHLMLAAKKYSLKHASKIGNAWLKTVIPTSQITTLMSFLAYTYLLNEEFLLFFLPLVMFVTGFMVMVVSTLRSLRGEKRFKEFVAWSEMLSSIESALNVNEAEDNYFRNHISPLLSMPPAVVMTVMSFSICAYTAIPVAELCFVSLGMGIACMVSFYHSLSRDALIAVLLQVFATLLENFSRLSDDSIGYFNFTIFSLSWIQVNFNLPGLCRCLSLFFVISLLFEPKRRNIVVAVMRNLVPCLYVMLWWEIFSLLFYYSDTFGLLRAIIEMIALFFSIPSLIFICIYAAVKWMISLNYIRIFATLGLLVLPLLYIKLSQTTSHFVTKLNIRSVGPALKVIICVFVAVIACSVFMFYQPSGLQVHKSALTLNDYYELCQKSTDDINALSKRACHQLNGHHVTWSGTVEEVDVIAIDNQFESVLNVFPESLAEWLSCTYGDPYSSGDSDNASSGFSKLLHQVGERSRRSCHLDRYNKYSFRITVQHRFDDDVMLKMHLLGGDKFTDFMFLLHRGSRVVYRGVLNADFATIKLTKISSNDVVEKKKLSSTHLDLPSALDECTNSLLRFFFSPLITVNDDTE